MKRTILYLSSILILLFITTGCSNPDGNVDSTEPQTTETSFNFTMASFLKQETASSVLGRLASFTADQVMTGQLTATNAVTLAVQTFDWSIYFDEETWEVQSNKTIILAPGTYDFALLLTKGDQQYAGSVAGQAISDGQFDVPMTIRPIIGNSVTDVSLVASLADFKFQYDQAELVTAGFGAPQLGVILDGGTESIFGINPATGISDNYINLTDGSHSIQLKLYDGPLQRGRSIAAQETVIVSPGLNIAMDLVVLHGETTFALIEAGGDASFSFSIPADVVDEAGGLANLSVLFSLVGSNNPLDENMLTLAPDGSGGATASITLSNKQFDNITLSLAFTDTATNELLGSCSIQAPLDSTTRNLSCDVTLRRRAIIGGFLRNVLGINVVDILGQPVAGAVLKYGNYVIGVTGSGDFGTEGYLKIYPPAAAFQLRAEHGGIYGTYDLDLSSLGIENIEIVLDPSNSTEVDLSDSNRYIDGGVLKLFHEYSYLAGESSMSDMGLKAVENLNTRKITADVAINSIQFNGARAHTRVQLIFSPAGYTGAINYTWVSVELRESGDGLKIYGYVGQCTDENCTEPNMLYENIFSGSFPNQTPANLNTYYTLSAEYLAGSSQISVSANGQSGIFDLSTFPFYDFSSCNYIVGTVTQKINYVSEVGDSAQITSSIDNVYIDDVLYDDFSSGTISSLKWERE